MRLLRLLFILLTLLSISLLGAPAAVTIDIIPKSAMLGQDRIRVTIHIEPDPKNRQLVLEWFVYEGFENRKFVQLDGETAPRYYQYWIDVYEDGKWTFLATVKRSDNTTKVAEATVRVIGGF